MAIRRPILDFEINPEMIGQGLTQSEMQTWDNCAEKWYLGYNLLLARRGKFSWALTYGGWCHSAWEEWYSTKGKRWHWNPVIKDQKFLSAEVLSDMDYWQKLGKLQMEIYTSHYKGDFNFFKIEAVEEIVEVEFEGILLKGMIDLLVWSNQFKGYYMIDHKTTGKLDKQVTMGWDFRLQFMFYCWLARKKWGKDMPIKGYFVNAMKKPELKRGVNESVDSFLQRVQTQMLEEDKKYFYRERLLLTKDDLQYFEDHILRPKIERVKMLLNPKISDEIKMFLVRNKNTDHCLTYGKPCEFMAACRKGLHLEKESFRIRPYKHEELIEAE